MCMLHSLPARWRVSASKVVMSIHTHTQKKTHFAQSYSSFLNAVELQVISICTPTQVLGGISLFPTLLEDLNFCVKRPAFIQFASGTDSAFMHFRLCTQHDLRAIYELSGLAYLQNTLSSAMSTYTRASAPLTLHAPHKHADRRSHNHRTPPSHPALQFRAAANRNTCGRLHTHQHHTRSSQPDAFFGQTPNASYRVYTR